MSSETHWLDLVARHFAGRRSFLASTGRGIVSSLAIALAGGLPEAKAATYRYRIRSATAAEKNGLATRAKSNASYAPLRNYALSKSFATKLTIAFALLELGKVKALLWQEQYARSAGGTALAFSTIVINYVEVKFGTATAKAMVSNVQKTNGKTIFAQYPVSGGLVQTRVNPPTLNATCASVCTEYDRAASAGVPCGVVGKLIAAAKCASQNMLLTCIVNGTISADPVCQELENRCNSSACTMTRCSNGGLDLGVPSQGTHVNFCCPPLGVWTGCYSGEGYAAGCCPAGTKCRCGSSGCGCYLV